MLRATRPTFVVVCLLAALATRAAAAELIAPGIAPKASSGGGQTVSRGPSALFYNPANLIFSKFVEPYLDVSVAKVTYTYQHTDVEKYDPVVIDVLAPPVTVGLGMRFVPSFALGGVFQPTASGAVQQINNVPIFLGDGLGYSRFNIAQKKTGYRIGAGAAFRLADPFTLGAGLIRTYNKVQDLITRIDEEGNEEETPFIDELYGGAANQFTVGARSEIIDRQLVLAASYRTAATLAYKGDILVNLDEDSDYAIYEGVDYLPAQIGVGAETRIGMFGVFFDYTREMWSAGRLIAKRGIGAANDEVDLYDTNNFVVGSKLWFAKKHMIQGAFGMYSQNLGDGTEVAADEDTAEELPLQDEGDDEGGTPTAAGMQFGSLDAIPRMVISGGYRYKLSGTGYIELGGQFQKGSRVVPEGFAQEGTYTLQVLMGSAGIAFGF